MKNYLKALFALTLLVFLGTSDMQAQRLSLLANVSSYSPTISSPSGGTNIDYAGSLSGSLNVRYYTKDKWAYRMGFGLDSLSYSVTGTDVNAKYQAQRQDI